MAARQAGRNGYDAKEPFKPTFHADKLGVPLGWKKPRRIAVNFMGDMHGDGVPEEWIDKTFAVMALCPQHTFLVLTKRPERMAAYLANRARSIEPFERCAREIGYTFQFAGLTGEMHSLLPWPIRNILVGTSIANQADADERYEHLRKCPGRLWYSIEPIDGPIPQLPLAGISWVVVGGGPSPVHPQWIRDIRDQCKAASVPFWFKQWGSWVPKNRGSVRTPAEGIYRDGRRLRTTAEFQRDGETWPKSFRSKDGDFCFVTRVGKKAAGRLLDGVEYSELPPEEKGAK